MTDLDTCPCCGSDIDSIDTIYRAPMRLGIVVAKVYRCARCYDEDTRVDEVAGVDRSAFIREAAVDCAAATIGGAGVDKSTDKEKR